MLHALLQTFGQTYYTYTSPTTTTASQSGTYWAAYFGLIVVFVIIMLATMWRIFTKAGKPGWAAIIPIYNTLVLLEIVGRPWWWIFLFLIPVVNVIVSVVVYYDLVKAFGKGVGYLLLLLFLPIIGFPMLAFGSAKYQKPLAK